MKHLKTLLFPLLICSLFITSCKDTDKDPDPCDNAVTVLAADVSQYGYAHFIGDNVISSFAPSQVFYLAKNWNDFSSKVVPGKLYKLAFKEVPCDWCGTGCYGDADTAERVGRCGTPVYKCIEIICLTEIIAQPSNNCYGINFAPEDFSHFFSRAIKPATISNHSLQTEAYFSGCSAEDPVNFRLLISELPTQRPGDPLVFEAKVEEISNDFICQAVFNKPVCFDLSTLPLYFTKNNIGIPDQVTIRFHYGNQEHDLQYRPIK
jgi:hypothetical protein